MNHAIILAAGTGSRIGGDENKIFLPLLGRPMIFYALEKFERCESIGEIIIAARKEDVPRIKSMANSYGFNKIAKIVQGGKERQDSVFNGLSSIKGAKPDDIIVVHNGCNPLVTESEINECVKSAKEHGASFACFPLKDTIKKIRNDSVERTLDRKSIVQAQTPQAIRHGLFLEAFINAKKAGIKSTDDVSLVESLGRKVKAVRCSYENIKVTTKEDMVIAEGILMKRNGAAANFRVGIGQDSHRFSRNINKKLMLGGYSIPEELGFEADSDGDVVLHSLFNAISQAIGERSLGFYADEMFRNGIEDSSKYLKVILLKLHDRNWTINNVGIMIEASRPKLEKHTENIRKSLSRIMGIEENRIGIAYTSGEGLTDFGKGKGMQCICVVSMVENFKKNP